MSTYEDANVKCPFFRTQEKQRITCEGLVKGCCTRLDFRTKGQKEGQLRLCTGNYMKCRVYQALEGKYGE